MGGLGFADQGFDVVFDLGKNRIDKRIRRISEAVVSLQGAIETFDQTCCTRHTNLQAIQALKTLHKTDNRLQQ